MHLIRDFVCAVKTPSQYYCPIVTEGMGAGKLVIGGSECILALFAKCGTGYEELSPGLLEDGCRTMVLGANEITLGVRLAAQGCFDSLRRLQL